MKACVRQVGQPPSGVPVYTPHNTWVPHSVNRAHGPRQPAI